MSFRVTNHNCCDLVRWQVRDQIRVEHFKDLSRPFSFFETPSAVDPDIVLAVGPFEPSRDRGQFWINHRYLVGPNYLYCREKLARGWYEVEIQGFDDTHITVRFDGKLSLLARAIAPLALVHHSILRPILLYHLSRQGACLLHAVGICRDEHGIVLAGRGGSFKTSMAMELVRLEGYKCLGDDAVIVSDAQVYPFPTHPRSFTYRALHLETEDLVGLPDRIGLMKYLIQSDLFGTASTAGLFATTAVPLAALVVVNRQCSMSTLKLTEISRETAVRLLIANNYLEMAASTAYLLGSSPTVFVHFLDAYALAYPNSRAAVFWNEFAAALHKSLDGVRCYELVMPAAYTQEVSSQVRRAIDEISLQGSSDK